jgi:hypothetical protein
MAFSPRGKSEYPAGYGAFPARGKGITRGIWHFRRHGKGRSMLLRRFPRRGKSNSRGIRLFPGGGTCRISRDMAFFIHFSVQPAGYASSGGGGNTISRGNSTSPDGFFAEAACFSIFPGRGKGVSRGIRPFPRPTLRPYPAGYAAFPAEGKERIPQDTYSQDAGA